MVDVKTQPKPQPKGGGDTDLYLVIIGLADEETGRFVGYTHGSPPLTWQDAQELQRQRENTRMSNARTKYTTLNRKTILGHNYQVTAYAVRSMSDPRFAGLIGPGFADTIHRKGFLAGKPDRGSGRIKAAKAWAKKHGWTGALGGWIYAPTTKHNPRPKPVCQGWESFAIRCARLGHILQGADGRWYLMDRTIVP